MNYLLRLLKMLGSSFTMTIEAPRRDIVHVSKQCNILRGLHKHSDSHFLSRVVGADQIQRRRN